MSDKQPTGSTYGILFLQAHDSPTAFPLRQLQVAHVIAVIAFESALGQAVFKRRPSNGVCSYASRYLS
jgi:hypothetical protein